MTTIDSSDDRADGVRIRELVESHLDLVTGRVKFFTRRFRSLQYRDLIGDLTQEGVLGLYRAVQLFDQSRNVRFQVYACYWIDWYIRKALSQEIGLMRIPRRTYSRVKSIIQRKDRLSDFTKVRQQTITAVLAQMRSSVYTDQTMEGRLYLMAIEARPDGNTGMVPVEVTAALDLIPGRERTILDARFGLKGQARTMVDIGRELGLSRERVRQLESQAIARLRRLLAVHPSRIAG